MRSRFAFSVLGVAALTACSAEPMNQKSAAEATTVDLEAARAAIAAANKSFDENYMKGDVAVCKYTQIPAGDIQANSRTCRGQFVRPSELRGVASRVGLSRAPSSRSR